MLQERHGVFTFEDKYNLEELRGSRSIRFGDVLGKPVAVVQPAFMFVAHLKEPNRLRVSVRHTAPERGAIDPNIGFEWDEDLRKAINVTTRALETLAVLQKHTSTVIRVPDFTEIPREQMKNWRFAAALLRGEELTTTYPEDQCLVVGLGAEVTPPDEGMLRVAMPLAVEVSDQTVDLGQHEVVLDNPTLIERKEHAGHFTTTSPHPVAPFAGAGTRARPTRRIRVNARSRWRGLVGDRPASWAGAGHRSL